MTHEEFRVANAALDIEKADWELREALSDLSGVLDNDSLRRGVTRFQKAEKSLEEANEQFRRSVQDLTEQRLLLRLR